MGDWKRQYIKTLRPYEALANAIIHEAVEDFRKAYKERTREETAAWKMNKVIRLIRSGWFGKLTDADPEHLIMRLEDERRKWLKKHRRINDEDLH